MIEDKFGFMVSFDLVYDYPIGIYYVMYYVKCKQNKFFFLNQTPNTETKKNN